MVRDEEVVLAFSGAVTHAKTPRTCGGNKLDDLGKRPECLEFLIPAGLDMAIFVEPLMMMILVYSKIQVHDVKKDKPGCVKPKGISL